MLRESHPRPNGPRPKGHTAATGIARCAALSLKQQVVEARLRVQAEGTSRMLDSPAPRTELTACAADGGIVAVGDATGAVHVYGTESEFVPLRLPPLKSAGSSAVHSLAVLTLHGSSALVVSTSAEGVVTASHARAEPWPPAQMARATLPLHFATGTGAGAGTGAGTGGCLDVCVGTAGCIFGAGSDAVALYDVSAAATAWTASKAGSWPQVDATWHAARVVHAASGASAPIDGFSDEGAAAPSKLMQAGAAAVDVSAEGGGAGGTSSVASSSPSRLLSYSPFWSLLAASVDGGGVVALWDVRVAGVKGSVAAVRTPDGAGARWIHLDEGVRMSGHLVLAPAAAGAPLQIYDIRRVGSARASLAARAVATLPPPANAGTTCFAAKGSAIVLGGAKAAEAWRYTGDPEEEAEEEEEEEEQPTKKSKEKKKKLQPGSERRMFNRTK